MARNMVGEASKNFTVEVEDNFLIAIFIIFSSLSMDLNVMFVSRISC